MITSLAPLFIKGHLLLALGQSVEISNTSQQLWISKEDVVAVQIVGPKSILKAKKLGRIYAHGLEKSEQLSTVDVVSPSDFQLLKGCAKSFTSFDSYPPDFILGAREVDQKLRTCPLSQLNPPKTDADGTWARLDKESERALLDGGIHFHRELTDSVLASIIVPKNELRAAKETLGPRSALYTWITKDSHSKPGRTLLFDIGLVEISTSQLQSLGLRVPTELKLKTVTPQLSFDPTLIRELGISFSSFEGLGKILSQPRLRVRPGDKAHFQSGGEIPIKQTTTQSSTVTWKQHGLILDVEPANDVETGASSISVHFQIELSEPDFSAAIEGIPAMKSRRLDSTFDLRTDEATVLGALTQSRDSEQNNGPWGLKWIPILGTLLNHTDNFQQSSELWFVVRPAWEEIPIARFSQLQRKEASAL